ncbi:group II intron maturase-specific domain-containing protein, partial [Clostridium thailandense]|uniref:group II intron maturase-specific domain-containing protein n=1 Tax=Clostridium thailandense TaxID=2794346 RepID=UPI003989F223
NPIVQGWVNYYRIGHCSRVLTHIKIWVEEKVRRFARKAQKKFGFGWKILGKLWESAKSVI